MEEGSDHKNLQEITIKYHSDHRKRRHELVEEPKNNEKEFSWTKNYQSEYLWFLEQHRLINLEQDHCIRYGKIQVYTDGRIQVSKNSYSRIFYAVNMVIF